MVVIPPDLRIVRLANFVERPPPQIVRIRQHIRLGHQRQHLLAVALPARRERPSQASLHPEPRRDHLLGGDLLRRAFAQKAPAPEVQVLRVLPDHQEIDVLRPLVLQRAVHARVQLHRPQVDVLIQLKTQTQQQAFLQRSGRHVRVAHRPQIDRIKAPQLLDRRIRQDLPSPQVSIPPEIVVLGLVAESLLLGHGPQDLQALANHLRPRAVPADHRNLHHILSPQCGRSIRAR